MSRAPMSAPRALRTAASVLAALAATIAAGCATGPGGRAVVDAAAADLAATPACCTDLSQARRLPWPKAHPDPATVVVDRTSQAFAFGATKAFFVMYELPAFERPWSLLVESSAEGRLDDATLFMPRVVLLDAAFKPTRTFDESTLRSRGSSVERTVFFNPRNADERYVMLIGSSLGSTFERKLDVVTSTPVMAGPVMVNIVGGQQQTMRVHASPVGTVRITAQGRP